MAAVPERCTPASRAGGLLILGASLLALLGLVLDVYGITLRSIIRQRPPITNLYDTVLFITGTAVLLGLLIEYFTRVGIGTLIALAHPLTILATMVAAPFTTLNPVLGAGFVAAGVELWVRKPNVGDFERLRKDVTTWRGWWSNRAARVLLVFVLSTIGASSGTFLASARIFGRLFG